MPRYRDRRKAASPSRFAKRGAKIFNGRAACLVNNSRFYRNDHKARHGHASLVTGRVLFKLQHHKADCLN